MGIEVVHDQNNDFHFWVDIINEKLNLVRPINRCALGFHITMMISAESFYKYQDPKSAVVDRLLICVLVASPPHEQYDSYLAKQLIWLFDHINHGFSQVVRELIYIKKAFNLDYKFCIFSA